MKIFYEGHNNVWELYFICFDCFTIFFGLFKTHLICFLGKNEFSPEEDAHVIGDCIKVYIWQVLITISLKRNALHWYLSGFPLIQYVLREMPSSPVPASCCTALVKAYRKIKTLFLHSLVILYFWIYQSNWYTIPIDVMK